MPLTTKTLVEECPLDGEEKNIEADCEICDHCGYATAVEYHCQHPEVLAKEEEA